MTMKPRNEYKVVALVVTCLTLAACGSGGGDADDDDGTGGGNGGGNGTGSSFIKLDDAGVALADQGSDYASRKWACVQDNDTGLIWEVKTDDDSLRDKDWTYSWYRKPNGVDLGNSGRPNGGTCVDSDHCDTDQFVAAVNATGLCGRTDWRLPTRSELLSIVHYGAAAAPFIAGSHFPNTSTDRFYWTADRGRAGSARTIDFLTGRSTTEIFFSELGIRLVSGGSR